MSVASLKSQRKTKKNQLNQYAKRRDAIKKIINNMGSKTSDDVADVNNRISACAANLSYGLYGVGRISSVASEINSMRESYAGGDGSISSCSAYLSKEVARCQNKINSLDREIKNLERQIKAEGGTIYWWE